MSLVYKVRTYWYSNKPGDVIIDGLRITKKQIQTYGGPIPRLGDCPTCQKLEWITRVTGVNHWREHECTGTEKDRTVNGVCNYWSAKHLCEMRESDDWTQNHQNFEFVFGVDQEIKASKCLFLLFDCSSMPIRLFRFSSCDNWVGILRRQLAQACQVDAVVYGTQDIDWGKYDFCLIDMSPGMPRVEVPIPLVLLGYDWIDTSFQYQGHLDYYRPEIFLTPYPCAWQQHYKFSPWTRIRFYSIAPTTFFSRPNVNGEKELDILSIGKAWPGIYNRRITLHAQVMELADRYRVEVSKNEGCFAATWDGANYGTEGEEFRYYLNAYSRKLGTARYVTYGPVEDEGSIEPMMAKYYECLSSGAIPILPDSPDRKYIGVHPWKHYIPLAEIWQNNDRLCELLDNPQDYIHIAYNAVAWAYENMDRQVFDGFENVVREVTSYRLGLSLRNKRVLEVGAGIGELTGFWEERDCEIVSTEARQENVDYNLRQHPWRFPYLHKLDVMEPNGHRNLGLFDIVFCYGLLYHVPDPALVIKNLAELCTGLFLVDSMVSIYDGEPRCEERTEFVDINQGIYPIACTPSRSWFMKELGQHFPHVYVSRKQPENQYFPTAWPIKAGCIGRAVFVASRKRLSTRLLSKKLLKRQGGS